MNPKKLLQILEICCPLFTKAEGKNGEPDTTTPLGYAIWFFARVAGVWKAIWEKDNDVMIVADRFLSFCLAVAFSIAVLPLILILWTIGNLIFSIKYDKKNHTHLFPMYSFVVILFIALGVMLVDYKNNGDIQEIVNAHINQTVDDINQIQPQPQRSETVRQPFKAEPVVTEQELIVTEPIVSEEIIVTEEIESEPIETEVIVEEGYTLQRISR